MDEHALQVKFGQRAGNGKHGAGVQDSSVLGRVLGDEAARQAG